jgi:uncharacterized metal-binding protein
MQRGHQDETGKMPDYVDTDLGIAHCAGLIKEAGILTDILENNGFEAFSVRCKARDVFSKR